MAKAHLHAGVHALDEMLQGGCRVGKVFQGAPVADAHPPAQQPGKGFRTGLAQSCRAYSHTSISTRTKAFRACRTELGVRKKVGNLPRIYDS